MDDPLPAQKDSDLAIRLMLGEDEAFREVIRDFGPRIKGHLKSVFRADVAEEAWVDAVRNVWKSADDYDESKAPFGAWFLGIAHNAALDIIRRQRRQAHEELGDAHPYRSSDCELLEDNPKTKKGAERRRQVVRGAIDGLTDRQRAVTEADLAYLSGDVPHTVVAPAEDLAESLNTNKNHIYKLRHDARRKLKIELERRGVFANGSTS